MTAFRRSSGASGADGVGEPDAPARALWVEVEAAVEARYLGEDRIVEFGRYRLLSTIGRGGMGQVFHAWDTQLERHVALKLLIRGGAEATLGEARCLARVAHPNVVSVHEVGRVGELAYIAMELVEGCDLREWLGTDRSWAAIVDVVLAAGRGLAAVHDAGLLHGDVKPGNVLIGRDRRVRVADFGLARIEPMGLDSAACNAELDALVRAVLDEDEDEDDAGIGAALEPGVADPERAFDVEALRSVLAAKSSSRRARGGTVRYMAPERLTGVEGGLAADQYSLCVTAWEALFGVCPFAGESREAILHAIALDQIDRGQRPAGMPRAIETILRRGLAEQPEARWPSIPALCAALQQARRRPAKLTAGVCQSLVALGLVVLSAGGSAMLLDRGDWAEQQAHCVGIQASVEASWGPDQRAALEQRFAGTDLPLPRSEGRFVADGLDTWFDAWSSLWSRACVAEPGFRRCLEHERERFDAVLALLDIGLDDASSADDFERLGAGRTLVTELGSPAICLDAQRGPSLDVDAMGQLAELSAVERRIEFAVLAGAYDSAVAELARFEVMLAGHLAGHGDQAVAAELSLRKLAVEPWRARVLAASGDSALARVRLRAAIREAESRGHDGLRFALLLEQRRLGSRTFGAGPGSGLAGPGSDFEAGDGLNDLDDLAVLDGLAERVDPGPVARAELTLARVASHCGSGACGGALLIELEAASEALDSPHQPQRYVELRFELALRRAQLHFERGGFEPALLAAEEASTIGWQLRQGSSPRLVPALTIAGISAAMLGECERVRPSVEALWTISERSSSERSSVEIAALSQAQRWTSQVTDWSLVRHACPYVGGDLHVLLGPGH